VPVAGPDQVAWRDISLNTWTKLLGKNSATKLLNILPASLISGFTIHAIEKNNWCAFKVSTFMPSSCYYPN
jgi:hypothetical protein